jgi:pimeloyl-ACP methyl ester carboxylesterase
MRIIDYRVIIAWALVCGAIGASAQTSPASDTLLRRRVQVGAVLADVRDTSGFPPGARVLRTIPGSPAGIAGLQTGDVVVRLGKDTIGTAADMLNAVRDVVAGTRTAVTFVRNGSVRRATIIASERPRETAADFDIVYTAVGGPADRRRVLVTHPRDGARHQTVLLVGGIGCYSIDQAAGVNTYRDLMYHFARRGYTTVRVEKAGVGDSEGRPCLSTDFATELAGYRAALDAARTYPWVDAQRIYLFGHSIGGIEAPLLAGESDALPHVRGVIVLSTVGIGWYEYELANLRRQLEMQRLPPDSVERDMSLKVVCGFRFLMERQARADLLRRWPDCAPFVTYPASDAYMQQVASQVPALAWRDVTGGVLVLWGGSDFVTSRAEHVELTAAINAQHPGAATFVEIPELDHYLSHEATQQASFSDTTPGLNRPYYGATLEPVVDSWLEEHSRAAG